MGSIHIDDPDDERLSGYRSIPDPELAARRGLFVAEGRLVVRRLLAASGLRAQSVMVTASARTSLADALAARPDVPVYVVPREVMNAIAGFNIHRGCLALGHRPPRLPWEQVARDARRLVILERVGNADNVGSIFRSAAAFAVDAIVVGPSCADPLYRKAIRTSMGAALTIPFAFAEPWPQMLLALRDAGWLVAAMVTTREAPSIGEVVAATAGRRVAVVVGHEGEGLTHDAQRLCSHHARIPMAEGIDSLNVATAAAIAMYEIRRARPEGDRPVAAR